VLFPITGFVVRNYFAMEESFAEEWFARGEQDLEAKRVVAALADFRTALSYSHNNPLYDLRLAQALMQVPDSPEAGAEARTYLLSLLDREPGNGLVNVELARLAARNHDVSGALLYYHAAVYGAWAGDQVTKRRSARLELVQFLLDTGQADAARAELIALAPGLPADPALQVRVGNLLLQVKGYDDALRVFQQALSQDPLLPGALAGVGQCYFQKGDYALAERYLARAVHQEPALVDATAMLTAARDVLNIDPFRRHLGNPERARRAVLAFNTARARLESCAAARRLDLNAEGINRLQQLYAQADELEPQAQQRSLSRDSELLSRVMDTAIEIEQETARTCSQPQGVDLALLLLAREPGGARP
jgi:predicted Zn-dependent protease